MPGVQQKRLGQSESIQKNPLISIHLLLIVWAPNARSTPVDCTGRTAFPEAGSCRSCAVRRYRRHSSFPYPCQPVRLAIFRSTPPAGVFTSSNRSSSVSFLGLFQYGLLHPGHRFGIFPVCGNQDFHLLPHRRQTRVFALKIGLFIRLLFFHQIIYYPTIV